MTLLQPGQAAPAIAGANVDGPHAVFFYKVTCPTCQMAAPAAERLFRMFPDRFVAVGQDPPERIEGFAREFGTSFDALSEEPPYETSTSFGVRSVPTVFVVDDGRVVDVVESWNRDAWNALAALLAERTGVRPEPVSESSDGLPPFRPG